MPICKRSQKSKIRWMGRKKDGLNKTTNGTDT